MSRKKVAIGISGGVDSAVSALLLKEQGYEVTGLFMKNWDEQDPDGNCLSSSDYEDAAKVCDILQISLHSINFVQEYWDHVFNHFLKELERGYTPNPDILCNREIKFKRFFEKAKLLGNDLLATGHYCQTNEKNELLKGKDPGKDQSYFLYTIKNEILKSVLFPIGSLHKSEVRTIAQKHNLPVHDKKDSTGICFIGKRNFKEFISKYIAYQPGDFVNLKAEVIGRHDGAAYYTIGQRKGLGIGGPGEAWFVVDKDVKKNSVVIEQGSDHPALYANRLLAKDLSFVSDNPPSLPFKCTAKIRYRQEDQQCTIESIENGEAHISFSTPQRAITPRQSIVFYDGLICLGGAMIEKKIS